MATKKNERKDLSFRLLRHPSELSFELKTGRDNNLTVYDEKEDVLRAIKHCPNEKSLYVDQQSKHSVVEPIIFVNGIYHVPKKRAQTQDFLLMHPSRGIIFELVDEGKDAQELLDVEDLILDMKAEVRKRAKKEGGIEEIRVLVGVLTNDVAHAAQMSAPELKVAMYDLIESNYERFLNDDGEISIFDDTEITRTAIAQHAFLSGVVSLSPDAKQVIWGDTKKPICSIPIGKAHEEYFAQFLGTEDGVLVAKEIDKRS